MPNFLQQKDVERVIQPYIKGAFEEHMGKKRNESKKLSFLKNLCLADDPGEYLKANKKIFSEGKFYFLNVFLNPCSTIFLGRNLSPGSAKEIIYIARVELFKLIVKTMNSPEYSFDSIWASQMQHKLRDQYQWLVQENSSGSLGYTILWAAFGLATVAYGVASFSWLRENPSENLVDSVVRFQNVVESGVVAAISSGMTFYCWPKNRALAAKEVPDIREDKECKKVASASPGGDQLPARRFRF